MLGLATGPLCTGRIAARCPDVVPRGSPVIRAGTGRYRMSEPVVTTDDASECIRAAPLASRASCTESSRACAGRPGVCGTFYSSDRQQVCPEMVVSRVGPLELASPGVSEPCCPVAFTGHHPCSTVRRHERSGANFGSGGSAGARRWKGFTSEPFGSGSSRSRTTGGAEVSLRER